MIHLQVDAQPFSTLSFRNEWRFTPYPAGCTPESTQVVVQVDDGIETSAQAHKGQLIACSGKGVNGRGMDCAAIPVRRSALKKVLRAAIAPSGNVSPGS